MRQLWFVAFAVMLFASACAPNARPVDDAAVVQQAIQDSYAAYSGIDEQNYRTLLDDDYALLENGELLDREGDVASMAAGAAPFHENFETHGG